MHARDDALDIDPLGLGGLGVGLVVDREVVEDVLLVFAVHPSQTVSHDVADLVAIRGVVGHDRRIGRCQQERVAVLVLQTLAVEGRATRRRAEDEAAHHLVHGLPEGITRALEAKHRVEDVDGDHRLAVGGVGRPRGDEGSDRAGLIDALVQDLAVLGLLVVEHQLAIDGDVLLPCGVVDLRRREERIHAERARLVGDDRHEARADALIAHEVLEESHEGHGRGDRLLARATADHLVGVRRRHRQRCRAGAPLRDGPAESTPAIEHVGEGLGVRTGMEVRREVTVAQLGVGDRDVQAIAEELEVVERELLHLVGRIATFEVRPERVSLDRLGEDHRRLARGLDRSLVGGVHLAVVVTAALQAPDLLVAPVLHQLGRARIAAEEVLADEGAILGLVGLEVAVGRGVHQVDEGTVAVFGQQLIPLAAPDDLDDVPARAAEERLELLDDLAVAADRAIQALQVAVDDEDEVVQFLARGKAKGADRLDLVHLPVAEVGPHALLRGVLDAAVVEVLVEAGLVDRRQRPESHRHGGELPEPRHEPGVGVRRQPAAGVRELLTESVELSLGEATLEEGARVDAGRCVSLEEHLVSAARGVRPAEEVVEADLVERGGRGIRRDVPANADARALRAVNHDGGVPADELADPALKRFVTGEPRLHLGGDGVDVVGGTQARDSDIALSSTTQQREHEIARAVGPGSVDHLVEGPGPLGGLLGVDVDVLRGQAAREEGLLSERIEAGCHVLPFAGVPRIAGHRSVEPDGSADPPGTSILAHSRRGRRRAPATHQ